MVDQAAVDSVLRHITEKEIVDLACDLVNIPSPTGYERRVAEFVAGWLERNGLRVIRQEIGAERMNVVGVVKGAGRGVSLQFNGHMDVPYSGAEDDLLYMSREQFERPAHRPSAFVRDGRIYGLGVGNMKAGLAAMLIAVKAVRASGIPLSGDLFASAVCGEIGRSPVGRYQGLEYEGAGFGTRYLVGHGIHTDYAVCVDNSGLKLTWVQPGVVYLLVTVQGLPGGAWATGSAANKAASQNAVIKAQPVIDAIEAWTADYGRRAVYECPGGTVRPTASITSIEAGTPYKASMRPGICNITMIVMIPPHVKPLAVQREVEAAVRATGVEAEVSMHQAQLGFEAKGVEGLVGVISDSYERLFHSKLEIADTPYCSVWTDTNVYNQNGIPCVKIGLGLSAAERLAVGNDAYDQHPIETMVRGARLFALVALEVCSRARF